MDFLKDLSIDKVRNLAEDAFNQAKPKTEVEARVYEVLSHKNWGTSSTIMNEIARDTYDYDKFAIITQLMWEALENQRPAAWRVVFKGLNLLEHLVKNGSERCVDDARNHGHVLRQLGKFNYYEGTVDRGLGVREKSKQLIEILSDDERVREERQKARKLREKFGGNPGGVSNESTGSGGKYSGYGNDGWNSGRGGGGGGYGEGGIDSERRPAGRYDNDRSARAGSSSQPTFASLPDAMPKKSKKKAKAPAPAPEVDLFSFDDPAPAPATVDDDFGDFQTTGSSAATQGNDAFAAPTGQMPQFAAFSQPPAPANDGFGSFAGSTSTTNAQFDVFGNSGSDQRQQSDFGAFSSSPQPAPAADDEFGDFSGAPSAPAPGDRMSNLVNLGGLSKNTNNTKEDSINAPVVANAAAASYLQEKDQIQQNVKKSTQSTMSFQGLDGLHKPTPQIAPVASLGHNPATMGVGGSSDDPFASISSQPATNRTVGVGGIGINQQQFGGMGINQGNFSMNGGMGGGVPQQQGFNNNMQGGAMGMMNQQGFNSNMQQGMQGGFNNNMQGGYNNNMQHGMQGGFNNNGMGGF